MTNLSDSNNEPILRNEKLEKEQETTKTRKKTENPTKRKIEEGTVAVTDVQKEFFDQLNKKCKIQKEEEEQQQKEEDPFIIHYYDWEEIPFPLCLPYGLVIKKNNQKIEEYQYTNKNETIKKENEDNSSSLENTDVSCSEYSQKKNSNMQEKRRKTEKKEKENQQVNYDEIIRNIVYEDIVEYVHEVKRITNKLEKENKKNEETIIEDRKEKEVKTEIEMNWKHDFIILTNIQVIAKHTNKMKEWNNLQNIIPFIIHLCCSPRSSICKNSFLTIKHVCTSLQHDKINLNQFFVYMFPFIIKKLDIKNNFLNDCAMKAFEEFMLHSNNTNDFEILRLLCSESNNKNPTIVKKISYFIYLHLKNIDKEKLASLNLSDFVQPFFNFINAKLEETKKNIKQVLTLFLEIKKEEEIIDIFKNGMPDKNKAIIEKQIKHILCTRNDHPSVKKKHLCIQQLKCIKQRKSNNDNNTNNIM